MDLRQVRCFVAVYEERSFSRAATRLHVVPSAVSAMVRQLEGMRDVRLFERTPLGVAPTAIADAVYVRCKRLLQDANELAAAFGGAVDEPRTPLVIGLPPSMSSGMLSGLLLNFMATYPETQLRVREGYSAVLTDAVVEGELDFAIVGVDPGETRVMVEPIFSEPLMLVSSAQSSASRGPVRCADAAQRKLVFPTLDNPLRLMIEREFSLYGIALTPALELDSLQATLAIVKAGEHATILPGSVIADVDELVTAELTDPRILRSLVAVYPLGQPMTGVATALLSELKLLFAGRRPP